MGRSGILPILYLLVAIAVGCDGAADSRTEYFEVGKDVHLSCNNVTWTDALYYIWKINITGVQCLISDGPSKPNYNNCTGGKVLHNTTRGESYLHIPSFTLRDEGMYTCETAYRGGAYKAIITVVTVVFPDLTIRQENGGGQRFVVCSAAGGKPKPTLSWEKTWDSPEITEKSTTNAKGTITMESWLPMPKNASSDNVTCVASHPVWIHKKNITMLFTNQTLQADINSDVANAATSVAVLLIVVLVALLSYATHKHRSKLGVLVGHCCQSAVPSSTESKEDQEVEEVEPYESYVQRVNSIYNSSADLFGV
ncbi:hypothetical protein ACEWY4_022899 [Coilia grayii]|uniref:Ig-like domain-containing protein n=1 Tax=Coilia grayii TaxID=363190 RepID=A0ABD1J346_9TELE